MSSLKKKWHYIRPFILSGVVFLFLAITWLVLMVIEWKKTGFIDPMNVLLLVIGIIGVAVCFLWVKLLIQMRKRGDLEDLK